MSRFIYGGEQSPDYTMTIFSQVMELPSGTSPSGWEALGGEPEGVPHAGRGAHSARRWFAPRSARPPPPRDFAIPL